MNLCIPRGLPYTHQTPSDLGVQCINVTSIISPFHSCGTASEPDPLRGTNTSLFTGSEQLHPCHRGARNSCIMAIPPKHAVTKTRNLEFYAKETASRENKLPGFNQSPRPVRSLFHRADTAVHQEKSYNSAPPKLPTHFRQESCDTAFQPVSR